MKTSFPFYVAPMKASKSVQSKYLHVLLCIEFMFVLVNNIWFDELFNNKSYNINQRAKAM